ncbi:MAG: hypothetical protein HXX08_02870 [Chloroflexi bacterium]|uniref:Uncharacterized protein n=1 Tax=Candidatus Chlorohelix allophototropha TaxID=3003348 RepID=A0A8T7LVB3_9CHLR|nr:hypothetical protein [Chloroflexota bacterium]WJW66680.1 hypothetical protein OZ401_002493 [Chloroflexota bacterium L227-S17]
MVKLNVAMKSRYVPISGISDSGVQVATPTWSSEPPTRLLPAGDNLG